MVYIKSHDLLSNFRCMCDTEVLMSELKYIWPKFLCKLHVYIVHPNHTSAVSAVLMFNYTYIHTYIHIYN